MNKVRLISLIFVVLLFSNIFFTFNVEGKDVRVGLWCKDILAIGDATDGDYNLLLKVRDPSRPGLQVLCIVPEGYEYTYRYPWTGKIMNNKVLHKYIGVASKGDTIPNIVKAGMALNDVGIAFGDADTNSGWKNPTRHAWDDFDWIRYACERANNEYEAVNLLTKDVVDKMHATSVTENLFVAGPNKGFVIEADAYRYRIKEIENGIAVMSNYPKKLWKTEIFTSLPISRSFDTVVEKYVRNMGVIRLKSIFGVRIVKIGDDYISVKPTLLHAIKSRKLGVVTKINLSERKTVGYFSVELLDIDGNKAKVRVCNKFKAWEDKMLEYIQPRYGDITVRDMFNWSRLHSEDLDGLRAMCEDRFEYEAVAVYKIPKKNYEIISMGWFSPNHACSSIYVPFHICDTDIYDPYEVGEAAELSLNLLNEYGHGILNNSFSKTETVLLYETDIAEKIATNIISDNKGVSEFFTVIDMSMQKQAFLTEDIWMDASTITNTKNKQSIIDIIENLWEKNYSCSLNKMRNALLDLEKVTGSNRIKEKIADIALDICKSRIDAAGVIGKQIQTVEEEFKKGNNLIKQGKFELGFNNLQKAFFECDMLIKGQTPKDLSSIKTEKNENPDLLLYFLIVFLVIAILIFILRFKTYNLD